MTAASRRGGIPASFATGILIASFIVRELVPIAVRVEDSVEQDRQVMNTASKT